MQWHDTFLFTIKREGEIEAKKERGGRWTSFESAGKHISRIFFSHRSLRLFFLFMNFNWQQFDKVDRAGSRWKRLPGEGEESKEREREGNLNAIVQQQQISCGTLRQTVKMKTGFYTIFAADKTNSSDPPYTPFPLQCACTALNKSIYKYWQFIRAGVWLAGGRGVNLYAYL